MLVFLGLLIWTMREDGLRQQGINDARVDRRQHEDPLLPDDRGRTSTSFDRHFPADVLFLAPLDRRVGRPRDAVGVRATPLVPVLQLGGVRSLC